MNCKKSAFGLADAIRFFAVTETEAFFSAYMDAVHTAAGEKPHPCQEWQRTSL